jgi:phosphatidyl-myo-inositol dimannoside synthase
MKALLLSEIFPPRKGGSGRWFWNTYQRLPRESIVVATAEHSDQEEFDRTHDLRVHRLPLSLRQWGVLTPGELKGYWRAWQGVRRVTTREDVAIVHAGRCLPEGWLAYLLWLWKGTPYLCYAHGEEVNQIGGGAEGVLASRQLRWMTAVVLRYAEGVIANSQNTARILREQWRVPASRIHVVHPGTDTTWFHPAPRSQVARSRLAWGERPVILTVGRLQRRKGQDHMILAMSEVRRSIPDALYVVVGGGPESQRLADLVRSQNLDNHVRFLGEVGDEVIRECYQQCDLFALPNRQVGTDIEGFGIVLLEAQACGKPVLAGASGGTAEAIDAPRSGVVVPCECPVQLASAVVELLHAPVRRVAMGDAGRAWVERHFDWSVVARQVEIITERISAQRRNSRTHPLSGTTGRRQS